eukprot:5788789-Amphidinium_carterae.2
MHQQLPKSVDVKEGQGGCHFVWMMIDANRCASLQAQHPHNFGTCRNFVCDAALCRKSQL